VELQVLAVGDVRCPARVAAGDVGEHPQLGQIDGAAVDPHPLHEELVVQVGRLQRRGPAAVDPGTALRVQPPPAQPPADLARMLAKPP
jgi:hypothetical protein